jgi:AhpD family alkylhydroperoxidase
VPHGGGTVESCRFGLAAKQCRQAGIDVAHVGQDADKAMLGLQSYVNASGLEKSLLELVNIRASWISNCAFCLRMHTRDARKAGAAQERLDRFAAWREAPCTPTANVPLSDGPRR